MIGNQPSIYNAQSVYNQGGGGGEFTAEINGVKSDLFFPPYLTPVEYIDTSDLTATNFTLRGSKQFTLDQNDEFVTVVSFDTSKVTNNDRVLTTTLALGSVGSNSTIDVNVRPNKTFMVYYGNVQTSLTGSNIHTEDRVTIRLKLSNKTLYVTDQHGNSHVYQSSSGYNTPLQGAYGVFGAVQQSPNFPYHGKFFYSYIRNNDKVKAGFFPARNKENNLPYIVEVTDGSVATNWANSVNPAGVVFGPDVDLKAVAAALEQL